MENEKSPRENSFARWDVKSIKFTLIGALIGYSTIIFTQGILRALLTEMTTGKPPIFAESLAVSITVIAYILVLVSLILIWKNKKSKMENGKSHWKKPTTIVALAVIGFIVISILIVTTTVILTGNFTTALKGMIPSGSSEITGFLIVPVLVIAWMIFFNSVLLQKKLKTGNKEISRTKQIAIASVTIISIVTIIILMITSVIIFTEENLTIFFARVIAGDLPNIANLFIISISTATFGVIFALLILKLMKKKRHKIKGEKSLREKSIAALSAGMLAFAFIGILIAAATTIIGKESFTTTLTEMIPGELPIITKLLVVSISTVAYGIFFALLILAMVLKELLLRNKTVTLVVNIAAGTTAIAYMLVFIVAVYLPMAGIM